jgi:cyanophycinase
MGERGKGRMEERGMRIIAPSLPFSLSPSLPLLLALLLAGCTGGLRTAAGDAPRGKLFIIGGGDRGPELIERMIAEAGLREGGYAVVLPMSSSEPDSAIIWSGEAFVERGLPVVGFNFRKGEAPSAARLDSLRQAALVYISGGDQARFMDVVAGTPIETAIHDAYRDGAMIAGTSAGAAVMSAQMLTGDQRRHPEYTPTYEVLEAENIDLAPGLGLLDGAIVDQHFLARSRHNRLLTAVIEFPEVLGIGIDESTALLVEGDRGEVVGEAQVLVFRNPERSALRESHLLGARGLRVDVYLPGESFRLR